MSFQSESVKSQYVLMTQNWSSVILQYLFSILFVSMSRNENSSRCPLRTIPAANGKRLFICRLNQIKMFVQMDIEVRQEGMLIHNRSLLAEMVCKLFYLLRFLLCFLDFSALNIQRQTTIHTYINS